MHSSLSKCSVDCDASSSTTLSNLQPKGLDEEQISSAGKMKSMYAFTLFPDWLTLITPYLRIQNLNDTNFHENE